MNIFVTGSEGFIGSHLTEALVKKGHNVKCLVLYNSFNNWGWLENIDPKIKKNIEVITGDIRDEYLIRQIISKKVEVVMNLAALIGIPYSYRASKSYLDTNVYGLLNILNASKDFGIKKVIQASTSEVYGTPKSVPITEEHTISGQSPYAASKIAAEQLALSYEKSFGLPVTVLRPFNTFGPRQSVRAIIPTIITQAIKGSAINVGSTFPTRDFLYVTDTVAGFIKAINSTKATGEIINLGTGHEISIKNLIKIILKILDKKIIINVKKERKRPEKSEVQRLLASNAKAKRILKWSPDFKGSQGLTKALIQTVNWYKIESNLRNFKTENFTD